MNYLYVSIILFRIGCNTKEKKVNNETLTKSSTTFYKIDKNLIFKDGNSWYNYHRNNIDIYGKFIALDADSNKISKDNFLKKILDSGFAVLKIGLINGENIYKLEKTENEIIRSETKNEVIRYYPQFLLEGKEIPKFNFISINGKNYNTENTKGKYLILKCWFIGCTTCVEEFPSLNKLVEKYKSRNDILFVSLTTNDKKNDLISFLNTRQFEYETIPESHEFITQKLKVTSFPIHIIVDKMGNIIRFCKSEAVLEKSLEDILNN